MKYIIAYLRPECVDPVLNQLFEKQILHVTLSEVVGHGIEPANAESYRNFTESRNMVRKIKLEVGVNDDVLDDALNAISTGAHSGNLGDGKIFILNLEEVIRVRTSERGISGLR